MTRINILAIVEPIYEIIPRYGIYGTPEWSYGSQLSYSIYQLII